MTLDVDGVGVRFGGVQALDGVSFTVPAGQLCALIGPNGAGKTTLLNVISGLYRATQGSVSFEGHRLTDLRRDTYASLGVSRTFQNLALFGGMSVADNVAVGAHSHTAGGLCSAALRLPGVRRAERAVRERCLELLDQFGIADVADTKVDELSFGTMKKVELARAMASRPRLLLLDEPAAGLTHGEVDDLAKLIAALNRDTSLTIVLVEHHMRLVMSISHRVVALDFGRVMADGSPEDVARDPKVISAYLGAPR